MNYIVKAKYSGSFDTIQVSPNSLNIIHSEGMSLEKKEMKKLKEQSKKSSEQWSKENPRVAAVVKTPTKKIYSKQSTLISMKN